MQERKALVNPRGGDEGVGEECVVQEELEDTRDIDNIALEPQMKVIRRMLRMLNTFESCNNPNLFL